MATVGSLLGIAGKCEACGLVGQWCSWIFDGELEFLHGRYGSMDAVFEVQHTVKRLEVTAFFCPFKKVIGPIKVHIDNRRNYFCAVERRQEVHGPRRWRC